MRYYSRLFTSLVLLVVLFLPSICAFASIVTSRRSCSINNNIDYRLALSTGSNDDEDSNFISTITNTITQRYQLFQQSKSEGYDFKQSTAIAIAGTYDANDVQSKINEHVASAPCVMFTWEASPSCKKAIKYLDVAGATYKIVRLDNPWSEGNLIRAELGKMVGRSSVPAIFIGGKYVGGFDSGVDDMESPGILEMAFKGTLREKLKEVGAL